MAKFQQDDVMTSYCYARQMTTSVAEDQNKQDSQPHDEFIEIQHIL